MTPSTGPAGSYALCHPVTSNINVPLAPSPLLPADRPSLPRPRAGREPAPRGTLSQKRPGDSRGQPQQPSRYAAVDEPVPTESVALAAAGGGGGLFFEQSAGGVVFKKHHPHPAAEKKSGARGRFVCAPARRTRQGPHPDPVS